MKRTFSLRQGRDPALVLAGTCLVAGTYGLVRLAYGLFLPDIRASLSMSSAVAGYVSSGASLAYCVGALFGLVAAHRASRLVLGALLTAGAGAAGMALVHDLRVFVPFAVLASAGAGLASPGLVVVVERNLSPPRAATAQAQVNSGTGPGLVAAGLLALLLLPQWRLGLALGAGFTVAAGGAVLLLDRGGATPAATGQVPAPRPAWPSGSARTILAPAGGALLLGAASAVVWTYGRSLLVAEGASHSASTVAWVALGVGGTLTVVTTRSTSRLHPTRAWFLTTMAVAASITGLGLGSGLVPVALLACLVFGWGFVAATSALIVWARLLVPDHAAPATSLFFVTLVLGQAVGSAVAGSIAEQHGLPVAFLLSGLVSVVAALVGLPLRPAATMPQRARSSTGTPPAPGVHLTSGSQGSPAP